MPVLQDDDLDYKSSNPLIDREEFDSLSSQRPGLKEDLYGDEGDDDNDDAEQEEVNELEDMFNAPSFGEEDLDKVRRQKGYGNSEKTNDSDDEEEESLYNPGLGKEKSKKQKVKGLLGKIRANKRKLAIAGTASIGVAMPVIIVFMFLSSLKIPHFANALYASSYLRLNSIMQERMTQNIFDATVTNGDSMVSLKGRSIIDRFTSRNIDFELAKLGQQDAFKMDFKDGNLVRTQIGETTIDLNSISRELFNKDYDFILRDLVNLDENKRSASLRERARVRYEYTKRLQDAVGENLKTSERYVRSTAFKYISDSVGFKFSGWRQKARNLIGKEPVAAEAEYRASEVEETIAGDQDPVTTGSDVIDDTSKEARNAENVRKHIEKKGGTFDLAQYRADIDAGKAKSIRIQENLAKADAALLAATVACMTKLAFENIDEIEPMNERQLSNIGLRLLAKKSQMESGNVETMGINLASRQLDGGDESPYYLHSVGQNDQANIAATFVDPVKVRPELSDNGVKLVNALTDPPIVGDIGTSVCEALLSPQGAIAAVVASVVIQAVATFYSGGGAAAGIQGSGRVATTNMVSSLTRATGSTLKGLVSPKSLATVGGMTLYGYGVSMISGMLSGVNYTGGVSEGADLVEQAGVGMSIVQNRQIVPLGGAPIPTEEAKKIDAKLAIADRDSKNKGFFNRYANIENPYSLIGKVAATTPTMSTNLTKLIRKPFYAVGLIFSSTSGLLKNNLFTNRVSANTEEYVPYSGNQQYGFTEEELSKMLNDPTYSVTENFNYISDEQIANYDASIGKCYSVERLISEIRRDPDCSRESLRGGDDAELKFRYAVYKLDYGLHELWSTQ